MKSENLNELGRIKILQPPVVSTLYGKIVGIKRKIDNKDLSPVIQYLGVPYAKPPVGEMRWKKPEIPRPWRGKQYDYFLACSCSSSLKLKAKLGSIESLNLLLTAKTLS